LDTRPPKGSNDRIDFFHKSIGNKDNNGHIVDRDGGKNKVDVGEASSMVKLVGPHCGEFGSKFVDNELIRPGLVM
jgi:hypothetical protein